MQTIICWDLDETILDTPRLFSEPIGVVAKKAKCSPLDVAQALKRVSEETFTFPAWFEAVSIEPAEWKMLEIQVRAEIVSRASRCLYPGVRELLEMLGQGVLITAGHPGYQQWKFDQTRLGDFFPQEDRHYVPLRASKADIIERYLSRGRVEFIEDRPSRLQEVLNRCPEVRCIRPRWPGSSNFREHPDDGVLWEVADTIEDLERLLIKGGSP